MGAATERFLVRCGVGRLEQVTGPGTGIGRDGGGLVQRSQGGAAKRRRGVRVAGAGERTGKGPAEVDGTWVLPLVYEEVSRGRRRRRAFRRASFSGGRRRTPRARFEDEGDRGGVCFDGRCARSPRARRARPGEAETRFPGPIASRAFPRTRAAVEATRREMTSARTRRRVGSREVDVSSRVSRSANRRLPCRGRRTTRRATRKEDSTRRQTQLFPLR